MNFLRTYALVAALPLAAACAQGSDAGSLDLGRGGSTPVGTGGGSGKGGHPGAGGTSAAGGSASASSSASSGGTTTSGGAPTSCSQVNGGIGCCVGDVAYWCQSSGLRTKTCSVCGWSTKYNDYECVTSGGTDPSGKNPIACK